MKKRLALLLAASMSFSMLWTGAAFAEAVTEAETAEEVSEVETPGWMVDLEDTSYVAEDITYPSRDAEVPATVTLPAEGEDFPLVVICHGHGGNRHENVGLDYLALGLAANGVASIRMDYPGCGESTEAFSLNNMANMKEDTLNAIEYATENYSIDPDSVGIFGYSMGGRIALELINDEAYDFASAVFLAPAGDTDDLKNLFGGADAWEELKATANDSEDGYVDFTTIYGQQQQLGAEWFDDLEAYEGDSLIAEAAEKNDAETMVIYALDDTAVSPSVSQEVADALGSEVVNTPHDGHAYGFYGGPDYIMRIVVENASDFFAETM